MSKELAQTWHGALLRIDTLIGLQQRAANAGSRPITSKDMVFLRIVMGQLDACKSTSRTAWSKVIESMQVCCSSKQVFLQPDRMHLNAPDSVCQGKHHIAISLSPISAATMHARSACSTCIPS